MKQIKNATQVVRRYKSNKLYHTNGRRYINKKELFDLFLKGEVEVIDAVTGDDITNYEIPRACNGMKVNVHDIKELFK